MSANLKTHSKAHHKTGLFLTGGGARGAYQVGVLQAILALLMRMAGQLKKIPLILFPVLQPALLMPRHLPVVLIILKRASHV